MLFLSYREKIERLSRKDNRFFKNIYKIFIIVTGRCLYLQLDCYKVFFFSNV